MPQVLTIEHVRTAFENGVPKRGLSKREIAERIKVSFTPLANSSTEVLIGDIEKVLKVGLKEGKFKRNGKLYYRFVKPRRKGILPKQGVKYSSNTNYEGAAGEMAVASELLLRGYNVNRFFIDEGIDLVAVKDKKVYNIQVKTSYLDAKLMATTQIKKVVYDRREEDYVRYIFVVRCGEMEFRYFTFSQTAINMLKTDRLIKDNRETYGITIKFDEADNCPYLVNGQKVRNIVDYQNNFRL